MLTLVVDCDSIKTYGNGKLAIDAIIDMMEDDTKIPEVIFLDINMPIMDGWQFLEEFIALPIQQKVRINIVTSSIDPHDKENWEYYKDKTHHTITYNHKPIRKKEIADITKVA